MLVAAHVDLACLVVLRFVPQSGQLTWASYIPAMEYRATDRTSTLGSSCNANGPRVYGKGSTRSVETEPPAFQRWIASMFSITDSIVGRVFWSWLSIMVISDTVGSEQ